MLVHVYRFFSWRYSIKHIFVLFYRVIVISFHIIYVCDRFNLYVSFCPELELSPVPTILAINIEFFSSMGGSDVYMENSISSITFSCGTPALLLCLRFHCLLLYRRIRYLCSCATGLLNVLVILSRDLLLYRNVVSCQCVLDI